MFGYLLCGPVQPHAAGVEKIGIIAAFQRQLHILLDQQDGDARLGEIEDNMEDLLDDLRREAERGFVQHQKLRLGHQRAADGQHLLLTARHAARHAVAALLQDREKLENFGTQRFEAFAGTADMSRDEVFLNGQALEDLSAFRAMGETHADYVFGAGAGDVPAVEADGAGGRPRDTRYRIQERGLAGAVRPEDNDDFAFVDLEVDAFKNADAPVSRAEPGDL